MDHSARSQSTGGNNVTLNKIREGTEDKGINFAPDWGTLACFKGLILLKIVINIPPIKDGAENRAPGQGRRQALSSAIITEAGGEGLTFGMGLEIRFRRDLS